MYLRSRRVRSAGRSSGSTEITLPTELEILEGVECRLIMRDGARPEIVLQPDVSPAQALFRDLWQKLRVGLGAIAEIGEFELGDFNLAFFPPPHWQDRPPLAYADALAVLQERAGMKTRRPGALARLLAFMAVVAGSRLGLSGSLTLGFGESVAYLITGIAAGVGTDLERGMTHRVVWGEGRAQRMGSPLSDEVWQQARPGLRRAYEQFWSWQQHPEAYAGARERWYKALAVEVGVTAAGVQGTGDRGAGDRIPTVQRASRRQTQGEEEQA